MENLKENCILLICQIDNTVDLLVKQNNEIAMNELLVVIDFLTKAVDVVFKNKQALLEKGVMVDEKHIIELLEQVVEAISNTDFVLVADLLNYEIKGVFEELVQKI